MKRTIIACIAFGARLMAQNLAASAPAPAPPAPQKPAVAAPPAIKPIKLGGITVSGSLRSRVETWDWFQPDSGDNIYAFSGNIFKLSLSQSREGWDWNAEFAVPFLLGLPKNPIGPGTQGPLGLGANYLISNDRNQNTAMLFPKQLYVRITQFGSSRAHMLKLGRFDFSDGSELTPKSATLAAIKRDRINQRLIGGFAWSHVGRSFDGMQYAYTKPSGNFTFVGALPTRGAFQTDGWGWNSTAFGYGSYTKPVTRKAYSSETRVFGIYYQDWRDVILKTDNRAAPARRADLADLKIGTFGGHSLHAFDTKIATFDAVIWGAAQTGKWGVQDHRAFAVDVEGGVQPKVLPKLKPWLRGGYYYGSGDDNPNDNRHETFFQILPTPRPFARFPFFNMMNNRDIFGILILRPHGKVTVSGEFHSLRLASANDLWYSGGGVYQPWSFGYAGRAASGRGSLANLYDMSVEYRASAHVMVTPYFGYAQGRALPAFIYPKGSDARFGYLEATYKF
jgi:hypothetical protein